MSPATSWVTQTHTKNIMKLFFNKKILWKFDTDASNQPSRCWGDFRNSEPAARICCVIATRWELITRMFVRKSIMKYHPWRCIRIKSKLSPRMALRDVQVERDEKKCDNDSTNLSKRRHLLTISIDHCLHHSAVVETLIPRIYLIRAHNWLKVGGKRREQKKFEIFSGDKITESLSISAGLCEGLVHLFVHNIPMKWTVNLWIPHQSHELVPFMLPRM